MSYINIHTEWLKEWGLTPSEAVVYGYLHGWLVDRRDKSVPFRQTQAEMAKTLGMTGRELKYALNKLEKSGYLEIIKEGRRSVYRVKGTKLYPIPENGTKLSQSEEEKGTNLSPNMVQNCTEYGTNLYHDTLYNHKLNTSSNHDVDDKDVPAPANNIKSMEVAEVSRLASEIRTEIQVGGEFANSAERLYGFDKNILLDQLQFFQDHLTCAGTTHKTRGDFRAHFNNWLRKQYEKQYKQQQHGQRQQQNGPTEDYLRRIAAEVAANGGLAF